MHRKISNVIKSTPMAAHSKIGSDCCNNCSRFAYLSMWLTLQRFRLQIAYLSCKMVVCAGIILGKPLPELLIFMMGKRGTYDRYILCRHHFKEQYRLPWKAEPLRLQSKEDSLRGFDLIPGFIKARLVETLSHFPAPTVPADFEPFHRFPTEGNLGDASVSCHALLFVLAIPKLYPTQCATRWSTRRRSCSNEVCPARDPRGTQWSISTP